MPDNDSPSTSDTVSGRSTSETGSMRSPSDTAKTVVRASMAQPNAKIVGLAGAETDSPVLVKAMPIWLMLLVRVTRVYLQTFFGLLGADAVGIIDVTVGEDWARLASVAVAALAPATVTLLQNSLEFLTKLDVTKPALRA